MNYTTILSTAEDLALGYVAVSQQEWIDNVIHERCRIAIEEIVKICVDRCLENGIQIPNSKEVMVELAFAHGWVKSLADSMAEQTAPSPTPTE
jgi:hypothetical protein